jgi:hypothetical protein
MQASHESCVNDDFRTDDVFFLAYMDRIARMSLAFGSCGQQEIGLGGSFVRDALRWIAILYETMSSRAKPRTNH